MLACKTFSTSTSGPHCGFNFDTGGLAFACVCVLCETEGEVVTQTHFDIPLLFVSPEEETAPSAV